MAAAAIRNQDLGFDPAEHNHDPVEKAYRDTLANGLETVLQNGAESLEDLVKGLNNLSIFGPHGVSWTPELLETELSRLGR
jgi:hypothetical protein